MTGSLLLDPDEKHIFRRVPGEGTTPSAADNPNDGRDFFLRELLKEHKEGGSRDAAKPVAASGAALVLARALDYALDVVGLMGKEVILSMLEDGYGLRAEDITAKSGQYLGALRDVLGESYAVIEARALQKVKEETGLGDGNLENTIELLKASYR